MDWATVVAQAQAWGLQNYPDAPRQHHAAFVYAVSLAVTAHTGHPRCSMREHRAVQIVCSCGMPPGQISFDQAVKLVEETCYGPLTRDIALMLNTKHCLDDAPGEKRIAIGLLIEIGEDTEDP